MRAVGRDEVDDRRFVLEMARKVGPARVGREQYVLVARSIKLLADCVQRGHAGVATARQVDGRKVQRQSKQVVAQRAGDELVDLIASLARHAADDRTSSNFVVDGTVRPVEGGRVEEALDQPDVIVAGTSDQIDRSTRSASSDRSGRPRGRTRPRSRDPSWCRTRPAPGRG